MMKVLRQPTRVVTVLALSLIAAVIAGYFANLHFRDALTNEAFARLSLFHDLRKAKLEDYMRSKASDVRAMSQSAQLKGALAQLRGAWTNMDKGAPQLVRKLYIDENPFSFRLRRNLRSASDDSEYTVVHEKIHDWARRFLDHFGYYDLFLIDPEGNILYTVEKEDDFATNLKSGPYAGSPLGYVFQRAIKSKSSQVVFSDYDYYAPSDNAPALFAGRVVKGNEGEVVGVFAVQLSPQPINRILRFTEGMGETGETYIVGNDFTMRSQSRFANDSTILKTKVDTSPARHALGGFAGAQITPDYRNIPVLSVYSPVDFGGPVWVLLAEIDEAEVLSKHTVWPALIAALIAAVVVALLTNLVWSASRRT